ncbi:MAG TPA: hypothetical protein VMF03_21280 [Steroidobacteraceae bacterium]|nr:hypothetical protein [Steroidobacteraceae bacterium]
MTAAALLALGACTDQVGLAHGDPSRDQGRQRPLLPDASNATVASSTPAPMLSSAAPAPMTDSAAAPLPRSTLQPSLPAVEAMGRAVTKSPKIFSAVEVTFSEHARALAAGDPRLTTGAVAAAVERELAAQQLLAAGSGGPVVDITIDDLSSTLASNASVMGYIFRNLLLIGEVAVPGPAGRPPFVIHARERVVSRDASETAASLDPVYLRFAQLAVAGLRGVAPPPQQMPR